MVIRNWRVLSSIRLFLRPKFVTPLTQNLLSNKIKVMGEYLQGGIHAENKENLRGLRQALWSLSFWIRNTVLLKKMRDRTPLSTILFTFQPLCAIIKVYQGHSIRQCTQQQPNEKSPVLWDGDFSCRYCFLWKSICNSGVKGDFTVLIIIPWVCNSSVKEIFRSEYEYDSIPLFKARKQRYLKNMLMW